jgi:hypothetical protein
VPLPTLLGASLLFRLSPIFLKEKSLRLNTKMWDQTHDAQKSQWWTALEDQIGVTTKISQTCRALSGSDR